MSLFNVRSLSININNSKKFTFKTLLGFEHASKKCEQAFGV